MDWTRRVPYMAVSTSKYNIKTFENASSFTIVSQLLILESSFLKIQYQRARLSFMNGNFVL